MGIGERLKPYQMLNDQVREEFALQMHRYMSAVQYCAGKDVLDSGCGAGNGTFLLSATAKSILGIDNDQEIIAFANKYYPNNNCAFRLQDVLTRLNERFDVIISFDVMEHLRDPMKYCEVLNTELRTDGLCIISTPNKTVLQSIYPEPNKHHVNEMTETEFTRLLEKTFTITHIYGQHIQTDGPMLNTTREGARAFYALCRKK